MPSSRRLTYQPSLIQRNEQRRRSGSGRATQSSQERSRAQAEAAALSSRRMFSRSLWQNYILDTLRNDSSTEYTLYGGRLSTFNRNEGEQNMPGNTTTEFATSLEDGSTVEEGLKPHDRSFKRQNKQSKRSLLTSGQPTLDTTNTTEPQQFMRLTLPPALLEAQPDRTRGLYALRQWEMAYHALRVRNRRARRLITDRREQWSWMLVWCQVELARRALPTIDEDEPLV